MTRAAFEPASYVFITEPQIAALTEPDGWQTGVANEAVYLPPGHAQNVGELVDRPQRGEHRTHAD